MSTEFSREIFRLLKWAVIHVGIPFPGEKIVWRRIVIGDRVPAIRSCIFNVVDNESEDVPITSHLDRNLTLVHDMIHPFVTKRKIPAQQPCHHI